jgi:hypothetical protein
MALSEPEAAALRQLIAGLNFVFAKTMPDQPHEYCTRFRADPEAFAALVAAIKAHGIRGKYRRTTYRYLRPGDGWQYWVMSSRPVLINRAKIDP